MACSSERVEQGICWGIETYAQTNLDDRPQDEIFAISVGFEIFDAEDADDLDDCHKESENEYKRQHDL